MARISHWRSASPVLGALLFATATVAPAQADDEIDRTPQSCVLVKVIRMAEAADDHTLVFRMKGTAIYRNDLPVACPQLKRGETQLAYHYRSQSVKLTRLCDIDGFTIIKNVGGLACRLGKFNPITAAEADEILGTTPAAATTPAAQPVAAATPAAASSEDQGRSKRRRDR